MFLCLIIYHTIKTYGEWRYSSTILNIGRWKCQLYAHATVHPGKHVPVNYCREGLVNPRTSLDPVEN
jgi:hypothetical protein